MIPTARAWPLSLLVSLLLLVGACATSRRQVPDSAYLSEAHRDAYRDAARLLDAGDEDAALAVIEPYRAVEPWHVPTHLLYQDAARRNVGTVEWYTLARSERPKDASRVLLAARLLQVDDPTRRTAYARAHDLDPQSSWPLIALAYDSLRIHVAAIDRAQDLLDAGYPREGELARGLADDSLAAAEARARTVVDQQSTLAAGRALLVEVLLLRAEQDPERREVLAEAGFHALREAQLDPGNPLAHQRRARVLRALNDDAGAAAELRLARDLAPERADLASELGRVLLDLREDDDAIDVLEDAVALAPLDVVALLNLAVAQYRTGEEDASVLTLQRAAELSAADDARAFEALGLVLFELGRRDEAALAVEEGRRRATPRVR